MAVFFLYGRAKVHPNDFASNELASQLCMNPSLLYLKINSSLRNTNIRLSYNSKRSNSSFEARIIIDSSFITYYYPLYLCLHSIFVK